MQALASARSAPGTGDHQAPIHPATAHAFLARLLVLPTKLGHAWARRTHRPTPAHSSGVPQSPRSYAMLTPNDVRPGVESLLP